MDLWQFVRSNSFDHCAGQTQWDAQLCWQDTGLPGMGDRSVYPLDERTTAVGRGPLTLWPHADGGSRTISSKGTSRSRASTTYRSGAAV